MPPAAFPELPFAAMRQQVAAVLLNVGRSIPPSGFAQFWSKWRQAAFTGAVSLDPITPSSAAYQAAEAIGCTHILRSADSVRIGARLMLPPGPLKGFIITTHGYGMADDEPMPAANPWAQRSLGLLALRLRGYPGSCFDVPAWWNAQGGWVAQGIHDIAQWSMPGAVGDVISACRAIRQQFGQRIPIALHGESFGGAIAIITASQLAGQIEIDRMVIGVPTMGDWAWRLAHNVGSGMESDIREVLSVNDETAARQIRANLRLLDTVVHARRVVCPVVMKIAVQDPVVPPPTVGAIYNALGSAPGTKWRFLVGYGHTPDTPMADLRRHALFERLAVDFLDPAWFLQGMNAWEDAMLSGHQSNSPGTA